MSKPIVYLACPYSHPDFQIRLDRFNASAQAAALLIRRGLVVYSPITMTHPIDVVLAENQSTMGSDYWVDFDEAFMDVCSEMFILTLDGWRDSNGIRREIEYFERQGKKISLVSVNGVVTPFLPNSLQY
jgi:Domain of unknown function (DUF1937).